MSSMPQGQHSKASRDLAYVTEQLKSGKTRSGRVLSHDTIEVLEEKRIRLKNEIEESRIARTNAHTTVQIDRVIEAVKECTRRSEAFFSAVGLAGSSNDILTQAKVLTLRGQQLAKEERTTAAAAEGSSTKCTSCTADALAKTKAKAEQKEAEIQAKAEKKEAAVKAKADQKEAKALAKAKDMKARALTRADDQERKAVQKAKAAKEKTMTGKRKAPEECGTEAVRTVGAAGGVEGEATVEEAADKIEEEADKIEDVGETQQRMSPEVQVTELLTTDKSTWNQQEMARGRAAAAKLLCEAKGRTPEQKEADIRGCSLKWILMHREEVALRGGCTFLKCR